jgi:hypothetical protein
MVAGDSRPLGWVNDTLHLDQLWLLFQRKETRHLRLYLNLLRSQNRFSSRPVIASGGPIVSLTTYGVRIRSVYLTIESIAAASFLPSRFILWLDDPGAFSDLPDTLKRLQLRGLEVRLTDNLGPHTKYYPTLGVMQDLNQPVVTADDDHLYTRSWLWRLMDAYRENPGVVNCHRAHVIRLLEDRIAADDIWLHVNALRAGLPTRQIGSWQRDFPVIPGTQEQRLMNANVEGSQNDVQIAKTYSLQDIAVLQQATTELARKAS